MDRASPRTERRIRPRSRPALQKSRRVTRAWRYRLAPQVARQRRRRGLPTLWLRVRRLLWSWSVWTAAAAYALASDNWGWAAGFAGLAIFVHLAAPREQAPQYGLDHDMSVDDPAFLDSVVGLTGTPFVPGNSVHGAGKRRRVLSGHARRRSRRPSLDHDRSLHLLARRDRARIRRGARRALPRRRRGQDPARRGGIGDDWQTHPRDARGRPVSARVVQPDSLVRAGRDQSPDASKDAPGRWAHRLHRRRRHCRPLDGTRRRIRSTGGTRRFVWRAPRAIPLQTGFAQNWLETTGELDQRAVFFPRPTPATSPVQTMLSSPATGASAARILYYLSIVCARAIHPDRQPVLRSRPGRDRHPARRAQARRARSPSSSRASGTTTGSHGTTARACTARLLTARHPSLRVQPHDASPEDDGGRRTVGHDRHDELRQPVVRLERGEQRVVHRSNAGGELQRDVRGRSRVSERITLAAWQRRGVWARVQELVASVFQEQA